MVRDREEDLIMMGRSSSVAVKALRSVSGLRAWKSGRKEASTCCGNDWTRGGGKEQLVGMLLVLEAPVMDNPPPAVGDRNPPVAPNALLAEAALGEKSAIEVEAPP